MNQFEHPHAEDTITRFNNGNQQPSAATWSLTAGQQSLWLMQRMHPEDVTYNTGFAIKIPYPVDPAVIAQAIQRMCSYYPELTAVFRMDGTAAACITGKTKPSLERIDATGWEQEELDTRLLEKQYLPFDLENGPVARMYIFSKQQTENIVLFAVHHIIYDYECKSLIYETFMRFCQEIYQGKSGAVGIAGPRSFREYAWQEHNLLAGEQGELHRAFWQQQAAAFPGMQELTPYKPGTAQQAKGEEASWSSKLPPTAYRLLKEQAGKQNVTAFAWLQTVFQLLVHRYTSQENIVTGVPVSNRDHRQFRDTLGYFVNLLPVTSKLDKSRSFLHHLHTAIKSFLNLLSHKQYPFSAIIALSDVERLPGKHPLLQHVLNYLVFPKASGGVKADQYGNTFYDLPQRSPFSLTMDVVDDGEQLHIQCKYKTALYEQDFISELCDHYLFYLLQSLQDPDIIMADFRWVRPAAIEQLKIWGAGDTDHRDNEVIHRLFATVAALYPEQIAVYTEDTTLTYNNLDDTANQLAHFILSIQPEVKGKVIGLLMKRAAQSITTMLGVLKTGAAYMPLDPDLPPTRIRQMLEATGCALLICDDARQLTQLDIPEQMPVIDLATATSGIHGMRTDEPDVTLTGEDAAYILFTSGSTGEPKPVQVLHAGVVNLVKDNKCLPAGPNDSIAQLSNFIFDGSTFEIFGALLNGACLHLLPIATIYSREAFTAYVTAHEINIALLPTSLFNRFAAEDPAFVMPFDRLFFGGEAAAAEQVKKVLPYCKHADVLVNAYGPTECTVITLYCPIQQLDDDWTEIPLGRPLRNVNVYVLDNEQQHVPPGATGELYISGRGVAAGYLHRPDLNANRFITAPWDATERLYATGDLVCYTPGGQVHFVGRRDQQFKFRGYRIEAGEIETALTSYPGVTAAVVHKHQPPVGPPVLTAFIETNITGIDTAALTNYLSGILPHYMIPGQIIPKHKFPLNQQRKIDRKTLLQELQQWKSKEYIPPQTPEEKVVAAIWERTMNIGRIGIHDNFFAIGGHSLLAARIMAEIIAHFEVDVSLGTVFRSPTIHTISQEISRRSISAENTGAQEIRRADRSRFIRQRQD